MQITSAETVQLKIPFYDPGTGGGLFPGSWTALDFVLLRLETETGLTAWGEGFSYFCAASVKAMLDHAILPNLIGRDGSDIAGTLASLSHQCHIIGRYGVTMFALSAVDIALHDLNAKAAGVSLAEYLGGAKRTDLPAYASLIRYGDSAMAAKVASDAAAEGFGMIKLHEIDLDHVAAVRGVIGDLPLTDDINCNWTAQQTRDWAGRMRDIDLLWLEEPTFPPEDYTQMATLRRDTGIPIAAGENLCTRYQFAEIIQAGGADYVQPSLTKIGGVAETMATHALAREAGIKVAHHAPYFGPGLMATMQVLAAVEEEGWLEWLYVQRDADLFADMPLPRNGRIAIPDGPGLGADPDPGVIAKYRVA
ncbi:MAG: mandelate racemase/muconate lactonizing enzyme family protein [Pseudomonadota bacterium]